MRAFISSAKAGLFCLGLLTGLVSATAAGAASTPSKTATKEAVKADPQQLNVFADCDAYGAPNKSGDGMTASARMLGIFVPQPGYGDQKQDGIHFDAAGIAACDRALESPLLVPGHWLRRVSLLRARAVHKIASGDIPGALKDLDQAAAAAQDPSNPYYARSLGLGIDLVRAYALNRSGDPTTALSLALRAHAARPYDRRAAWAALIAIGPDAPAQARETLLKTVARQAPEVTSTLFDEAFDAGKFDEAIALHPWLVPGRTPLDNTLPRQDRALQQLRDQMEGERFAAWRAGQLAYALAATGQPDRARATIAAAREHFAKATTLPAAPSPGDLAGPYRAAAYRNLGEKVVPWIDYWSSQVEIRLLIREKRLDEAERQFAKTPSQAGAEGLDILGAVDAGLPAADLQAHVELKAARQKMAAALRESRFTPSLGDFYTRLPEAETHGRIALFWTKSAKALKPSQDDFLDIDRVPGSFTARFLGTEASMSMVQEAALLTAADLVRAKGGRFFRILRAQDISHSVQSMMYGQKMGKPTETGYETRFLVLPVDPASTRGDWRVLDADEIHDRLEPVYGRTVSGLKI